MGEPHAASPPSKRIKLESSPSPSPEQQFVTGPAVNGDSEDTEPEDRCSICLQSFLDRTIISTCAHEFCFECILLWSEQSRKCPLCSRSFDNSYLIHRIRSQYDYQKHYLPPSLPSTGESRARALRNTRRVRQWGRRERQQREEADQLERAVARRRWIYQHGLYAKHVASNPYTRYRPFPTPAQFAVSPDLVSRMTTFLRRELRVWPNLDVEFLTTFTISLMKSIDIRAESAVKLLSEFLDLDTPCVEGRHANAEHFAHEIYCYLRSPHRDLNTYDEVAQYDTPPDISLPQEIGRGSRWNEEPSRRPRSSISSARRSSSRSISEHRSPTPPRENRAAYSLSTGHPRDSSAEDHHSSRPHRKHRRSQSPSDLPRGRRELDSSKRPSRLSSPPDRVQDTQSHDQQIGPLRDLNRAAGRDEEAHRLIEPSSSQFAGSAVVTKGQDDTSQSALIRPRDQNGKQKEKENTEEQVCASDAPRSRCDNSMLAAALEGPDEKVHTLVKPPLSSSGYTIDEAGDRGDQVQEISLRNLSRKRSTGALVRPPRNRTLLESVQAHLARPRRVTEPKEKSSRPSASENEQPAPPSELTGNNNAGTTSSLLRHNGSAASSNGRTEDAPSSPAAHSHTRPSSIQIIDINSPAPPPHIQVGEVGDDHDRRTNGEAPTSSGTDPGQPQRLPSDMRSVLLRKLHEEQRRAAGVDDQSHLGELDAPAAAPPSLGASRGSPPTDHTHGPRRSPSIDIEGASPPMQHHHKNDAGAIDAETRLRVRLAAIKGTPPPRPRRPFSQNDPSAGRESSDGGASISSGREEALRGVLRGRRS
ncbi:hypothetical protein PAXRUDRAFT_824533 [Paxillus rubicundulus Ve08.2h10]|uniref:RING-type E3 ubiquitin transferase n=1 Tax=Paxillus rubicundulus Ve08.2h10 TaxID=930991 RepID=A0A0D0DU97_9AGAM|nr:hypothetical protein PAXRUDRAFT_824533 [Paxillus rubicundulus Ve08.2h10]